MGATPKIKKEADYVKMFIASKLALSRFDCSLSSVICRQSYGGRVVMVDNFLFYNALRRFVVKATKGSFV